MSGEVIIETRLWPPSVNSTWRSEGGRNILSKKARDFRAAMQSVVVAGRAQKRIPRQAISGEVAVKMILFPPDRKRRDLDNYQKGVFDALTKARFWLDDSQVRRLWVEFGEVVKGGAIRIEVKQLGQDAAAPGPMSCAGITEKGAPSSPMRRKASRPEALRPNLPGLEALQ